jgi:hypothetical protein
MLHALERPRDFQQVSAINDLFWHISWVYELSKQNIPPTSGSFDILVFFMHARRSRGVCDVRMILQKPAQTIERRNRNS